MQPDVEEAVRKVEQRADAVGELLQFAPRAFVIEFAGTPKSGKSTSVEAIRHFFSRHGFRVHVLAERASVCPIPMKGHLFFNTWCASTMLAELLENVETETDLIIVDRGLLDALVWLTLQRQRGEVTAEEARTIEEFLLLDRWRSLIDLAVVMNVSADEAMSRENSQRISRKSGSIMNLAVLSAISESVVQTIDNYGSRFAGVIRHETSGEDVRSSNVRLADQVIDHIEAFLNPEILVVPRGDLSNLPLIDGGGFSDRDKQAVINLISSSGKFMRRSEAEQNADFVQIIACGLLTYENEVFLFERKERDPKYRLYGKATMWQGTHVAKQDGSQGVDLLKVSLLDRIARSLFLSRSFPVELVGYCWDREDPISSRHFGVIFHVQIDNDHTAINLRRKEFRSKRGHGFAGNFVSWNNLRSSQIEPTLETWSLAILRGLKGGTGIEELA
jgi:predicted NUDIX family phosphoesterase